MRQYRVPLPRNPFMTLLATVECRMPPLRSSIRKYEPGFPVKFHVIFLNDPAFHSSPPFGEVTVNLGPTKVAVIFLSETMVTLQIVP